MKLPGVDDIRDGVAVLLAIIIILFILIGVIVTQSWSQIEPQLLAYGHGRKDAVADALRRFYERVLACGCRQR